MLSVASARLGPTVDSLRTASTLDGAAINTQIAVSFTEPMRVPSVEHAFRLTPPAKVDFSWAGNTMVVTPRHNLEYGRIYTVTIGTGATDSAGRHLARTYLSSFTTQDEHLLYVGTGGDERNRLVLASIGGHRETIGDDGGNVTGFSLSADRTLVVYAKRGSSGERPDELWLLSLSDNSSQRVFRRPDWTISQPTLSPDGRYVAFLATNVVLCRKYYGCYRDRTSPLIYLLDLRSHRAQRFRSSGDVPITTFIDFSPSGQIAYTDLGSALTLASVDGSHIQHVPNGGNSLDFSTFSPSGDKAAFVGQTPASTGGDILVYIRGKYLDVSRGIYDSSTPSFSSSGTSIAYAAYRREVGIEPVYSINTYDFGTGKTQHVTNESQFSDWKPVWSPDDRYIAFVRSQPQEAMYLGSGEIWVTRSDGREAHSIGGVGRDLAWVS